jgi:hypothetical protein
MSDSAMTALGQTETSRPIQQNDSFTLGTGNPSALGRTSARCPNADIRQAVNVMWLALESRACWTISRSTAAR